MGLQRNKVENLRLAIRHLDDRALRPGEELSSWRCVGYPSARRGYLPGLVLVHGRMASDVGGGLCQLSDLLRWMVLHTTMPLVERHHHGYDSFPDSGRVVPFDSGATVFCNYVDFRFANPGPETYRIRLWLTDEELRGELWADRLPPIRLHVHEQGHRFFRVGDQIYRENQLVRTAVERRTGCPAGQQVVMHNVCAVLYQSAWSSKTSHLRERMMALQPGSAVARRVFIPLDIATGRLSYMVSRTRETRARDRTSPSRTPGTPAVRT